MHCISLKTELNCVELNQARPESNDLGDTFLQCNALFKQRWRHWLQLSITIAFTTTINITITITITQVYPFAITIAITIKPVFNALHRQACSSHNHDKYPNAVLSKF